MGLGDGGPVTHTSPARFTPGWFGRKAAEHAAASLGAWIGFHFTWPF